MDALSRSARPSRLPGDIGRVAIGLLVDVGDDGNQDYRERDDGGGESPAAIRLGGHVTVDMVGHGPEYSHGAHGGDREPSTSLLDPLKDLAAMWRFTDRNHVRAGAFRRGRVVIPAMRCLVVLALLTAGCSRQVFHSPVPALAVAPEPLSDVPPGSEADLRQRHILVPVAGADMTRVADSFNDARDGGGRVHRAVDILAPRGTPVLAADAGTILRMTTTKLGGISLYAVDTAARFVYYYAHMERYSDAMSPGRPIVRGDTLGFVGTTGNAPKNVPHLHFQVMRWPADGKYLNAEPVNPFLALGGVPREHARDGTGHPRSH